MTVLFHLFFPLFAAPKTLNGIVLYAILHYYCTVTLWLKVIVASKLSKCRKWWFMELKLKSCFHNFDNVQHGGCSGSTCGIILFRTGYSSSSSSSSFVSCGIVKVILRNWFGVQVVIIVWRNELLLIQWKLKSFFVDIRCTVLIHRQNVWKLCALIYKQQSHLTAWICINCICWDVPVKLKRISFVEQPSFTSIFSSSSPICK